MPLQYVPALPVKRGDVLGFAEVASELAAEMAPLWTIPVLNAPRGEAPSEDDRLTHLSKAARYLKTLSPIGSSWIDTVHVEENPRLVREGLWEEFGLFITAAPVTGPERSPAQRALASELARSTGNGLGVRISSQEMIATDIRERVRELLRDSEVEAETVDLLLDLGSLGDPAEAIDRGVRAVEALGAMVPWRNLVLVSGAFPASSQGWQRDQVSRVPRPERSVWQAVAEQTRVGRGLVYGDYSIVHPGKAAQVSSGPVTILGKVLYTAPEEYLVVKGRAINVYGTEQMHRLAARISRHPLFRGQAFSAGEHYIADCAEQRATPGMPERWVRAGHTQHLTFVIDQLR
ncbi:beta family protein [Streptomyces auratus]|uniref:Beta family protein n=1 Tax=Streptomyces auratus AGR0001 TaxID=1160718 RepID=J1RE98_9ACTN|nr:beta family protein [Streptomyces auratus]QTZ95766.1 beta family protein [Streptomyces auratus AGR0001]